MHDPLMVAIFTVAGDTGELHPRRDARRGGGRVPTGQDGVGTGAATIGHEGAQGGADRAPRQRTIAHRRLPRHAVGGARQPDAASLLPAVAGGGQSGKGGTLHGGLQAGASGVGAGDDATTI